VAAVAPVEQPDPRRWWALGVLCLSLVITALDNTILNVALPTLVRDIHASSSQLQWIVDAYSLVFAGLLLTCGSLGDRFGRLGALTTGLLLFGAGSAVAATSSSAGQLIACRAVMGVGGALVMPATLSILTNVFHDPRERAKAIAVWAGVSALGFALGPIAGGALLAHFSLGSVFLVNLPIVATALVLGRFFVPTSKDPTAGRLDPVGAALSTLGLSALLWAIIEGPSKGWTSESVLIGFAAAGVVLGSFVAWELHSDHPMLNIGFFKNPRFSAASLALTLAFFAMAGTLFMLTQLLQFVLGYSPLVAGLCLLPMAATFLTTSLLSPRVAERLGAKLSVTFGISVMAGGLLVMALFHTGSGYPIIAAALVVMAAGLGTAMAAATESIMGSLPREKAGVGSAVNDTTRQVGGALGVAVLGSLLVSGYRSSLASGTAGLGLGRSALDASHSSVGGAIQAARGLSGHAGAALRAVANSSFIHGLHLSLIVAAVVCFGGAALAFKWLPARARHDAGGLGEVGVEALVGADVAPIPRADVLADRSLFLAEE